MSIPVSTHPKYSNFHRIFLDYVMMNEHIKLDHAVSECNGTKSISKIVFLQTFAPNKEMKNDQNQLEFFSFVS